MGCSSFTPERLCREGNVEPARSAVLNCRAEGGAVKGDGGFAAAGNALEECSGAKDTGAIKALLREHGAVTALMTGSGAAVFGVFRDEGAARAAAQAAKRRWKQVYVAQPDRGGARVSR